MKLQFFKFGEDYKRFLQLCWFYWLSWLCSFGLWSSSLGARCSFLFGLDVLLGTLRRNRASFWSMLVLMMLLLADFLGVRDVSWISHQLIDGSQRFTGRISPVICSRLREQTVPARILAVVAISDSTAINAHPARR
jgi:hypothetical protein